MGLLGRFWGERCGILNGTHMTLSESFEEQFISGNRG
jgi:hypothetical protein